MKVEVEITTNAYDEPYRTSAVYSNDDSAVRFRWTQLHEGENKPSVYDAEYDRTSGKALIRRSGEVSTTLEFIAGQASFGKVETVYGTIPVDIRTEYINVPSAVSPVFEICYKMKNSGSDLIENTFSIKMLLQKMQA